MRISAVRSSHLPIYRRGARLARERSAFSPARTIQRQRRAGHRIVALRKRRATAMRPDVPAQVGACRWIQIGTRPLFPPPYEDTGRPHSVASTVSTVV